MDARTPYPPGLRTLFLTEMWERFSFYGMRALLVLYLVKALGYPRDEALTLYGVYTSLVYLTPLLGGWISDRFLGARRAVVVGGVVVMLGHVAMAFEPLLHLALGLIVAGSGLFTPSNAGMVGQLYDRPDHPQRAGAYSLYYMGVNLGAFLAPLVVGTLGETVGWHWGFSAAAVGMALGVLQFIASQSRLQGAGLLPGQGPVAWRDLPSLMGWALGVTACVVAVVSAWLLPLWGSEPWLKALVQSTLNGAPNGTPNSAPWQWEAGLWVPAAVALTVALAVGWATRAWRRGHPQEQPVPLSSPALTRSEWARIAAILTVMLFVIAFWTGFEQAGGTMNLFADQNTQRQWGGWEIPASLFQSINPVTILLLAPVFSWLWLRLDSSPWALSDVRKQALGMGVLGLGFVLMAQAQSLADTGMLVSPWWLVAVYVLHTTGELMLAPVGLAMVSRLAPARLATLMMGAWMLGYGASSYLAGTLESLLEGSGWPLYPFLAALSMGAGLLLWLLSPLLERWMRE